MASEEKGMDALLGALGGLAKRLGLIERLAELLASRRKVIVVGSTGVGKTALIKSLVEAEARIISAMDRTVLTKKDKASLKGKKLFTFDMPGEMTKAGVDNKLLKTVLNSKGVGLIIVTAYGYHEYRPNHAEVTSGDPTKIAKFLSNHRAVELEHLEKFNLRFNIREKVDWAIPIVTKADLWWKDEEKVLKHYAGGQFRAQMLNACAVEKLALPVPYSASINSFCKTVPTSPGFGESERVMLSNQLASSLVTLL